MKQLQKYASIFTITLSFASSMLATENNNQAHQDVVESIKKIHRVKEFFELMEERFGLEMENCEYRMLELGDNLAEQRSSFTNLIKSIWVHDMTGENFKQLRKRNSTLIDLRNRLPVELMAMRKYKDMNSAPRLEGETFTENFYKGFTNFVMDGIKFASDSEPKALRNFLHDELPKCQKQNKDRNKAQCTEVKNALRSVFTKLAADYQKQNNN